MKKLIVLITLVILTFPAYKALRHIGMISGHDTEAAVFKAGEYFNAVKDGHFPPRWSKRLDFGLGQPTFTFTYPFPYILTTVVMFLGLPALTAFKLVMAASFPTAALFCYLWISNRFGTWPGVAAGMVYALAPYHFANVYVRGAIGETVAASILPLSFYALDKLGKDRDFKSFAWAALAISAVILSHPFYGLIFSVIWVLYAVVNKWPRFVILAIAGGYLLAGFYIIPAFFYKNLTYLDRIEDYFLEKQGFVTISKLIYSPWGYAAVSETEKDPMSVQIGMVAIAVILGTAIVTVKKRNPASVLFLTVIAACVFMMLEISLPIWETVSPLRALQFPWRLLFVVNISAAFCAGYLLATVSKRTLISIGVVTVMLVASRNYWSVGRYYREADLPDVGKTIGYPGTLTMLLEETPKWHVIQQESNPYTFFNVQSGIAGVRPMVWKTNYHKLEVTATEKSIINDKTHYWPGWKVFVDGKETKLIDPYSKLSQGTLAFEVEPGVHVVESKLTEPGINKLANSISILSLAGCIMLILKRNAKVA